MVTWVGRILLVLAAVVLLSSCRPYVIFASGPDDGDPACDQPEVVVEGASLFTNGRVHSNGDLTIGEQGEARGRVTSVGDADIDPGVVLSPADDNPAQVDPREFAPVDIADYRPGGSVALIAEAQDRYYDFTGEDIDPDTLAAAGLSAKPPGIYYTDGDIDLDAGGTQGGTLVAEGQIVLGGGTYWDDDPGRVLALSGHDGGCDDPGIAFAGANPSFIGRLVAPDAGVELISEDPGCEESFISAQTQIVGTWVRVAADRVWMVHLPDPEDEKFLELGCAIG